MTAPDDLVWFLRVVYWLTNPAVFTFVTVAVLCAVLRRPASAK